MKMNTFNLNIFHFNLLTNNKFVIISDNDVLSTSTISKTEEHSRLKDVEDSFEDRYMKVCFRSNFLDTRPSYFPFLMSL